MSGQNAALDKCNEGGKDGEGDNIEGAGHSRFFVLLPVLEGASSPEGVTPSKSSIPKQPASHDITGTHNSTKFQLQYLCDCAGFKKSANSHWINKSRRQKSSRPLTKDLTNSGPESSSLLVNIDKVLREEAQRVSLVIEYLRSKGIQSCQGFVSMDSKSAVTESMLDQLPPIAVLDETTLSDVKSHIV
ncbi:MAG: hypothetical protein J3R72DRAFT_423409 [Linnemannia gamsii]|nr:MAG: hypothetical protein J3R72DRAFT_423409 [Linnemannia gamsii]